MSKLVVSPFIPMHILKSLQYLSCKFETIHFSEDLQSCICLKLPCKRLHVVVFFCLFFFINNISACRY